MKCKLLGHRWPRWEFDHHFSDTSYGGEAPSSMFVRECRRCGLVKSKSTYGVTYRPRGAL